MELVTNRARAALAVCALTTFAIPTAPAHAQTVTFDNIADSVSTNNGVFQFVGLGDINNSGTVAFSGGFVDGGSGVYTSTNGMITQVADTTGAFRSFGNLRINASGTVAFNAESDDNLRAIYASTGGVVRTIVDRNTFNNPPFISFGGFALNDSGTVAFVALMRDFVTNSIYTTTGDGVASFVAAASFREDVFNNFYTVALNNAGTMAFQADLNAGGHGVYTANGAGIETIVDSRSYGGGFEFFG
ncbi:MAG: hypothetical protein H7Y38_11645 [Armatimonadetes bacterium]|nr:hypothetical protein [Armatimonadota bacterium]